MHRMDHKNNNGLLLNLMRGEIRIGDEEDT